MSQTRIASLRMSAGAGLVVAAVVVACQSPEPRPEPAPEPTTSETQAVHDEGLFELDGNAQDDPNVPGDDWSTSADPTVDPIKGTIFIGGGSKDPNDIPQWDATDGSVPDKDDLLNGNAVTYTNTEGELIIYFAADRFATNGDAQIGFWFLQDDVTIEAGDFTGEHREGDILVLTDFTNGGTIGTIQVCTWAGGDGAAGQLECLDESVVSVGGGVFCSADDIVCAAVNTSSTGSAWPYDPKTGANDIYSTGAFFEGGINVTELLGRTPCFGSFLTETRSSQSVTATLKDFILGDLQVCAPSADICKQCEVSLVNVEGGGVALQVGYSGWACNTGNVDLSVDLVDDQDGTLLDDVVVAAETCVAFSGDYQPVTTSETDPTLAEFTDTVTFTGSHPELDDLVAQAEATCTVCQASDACADPPFAIPSP